MERQAPVQGSHRPTKTNEIHNARTQRVCNTEMLSVLLVAAAFHTRSCRSMHSPRRNSVPCQHIISAFATSFYRRWCIQRKCEQLCAGRGHMCGWPWGILKAAITCMSLAACGAPRLVNSVVSGWRRSFPLTTTAHSCSRVRLRMRGQLYLCCCRWWHAVVQRGDCRRLRLAPGCGSNRLSRSPSRYAAPGCS